MDVIFSIFLETFGEPFGQQPVHLPLSIITKANSPIASLNTGKTTAGAATAAACSGL